MCSIVYVLSETDTCVCVSKRAVSQMLAAAKDGDIKAVEQFLTRFPADACIQVDVPIRIFCSP